MSSNIMTISEDKSPIMSFTSEYTIMSSEYTSFTMSPTVEGEFPSIIYLYLKPYNTTSANSRHSTISRSACIILLRYSKYHFCLKCINYDTIINEFVDPIQSPGENTGPYSFI